MKLVFFVTKTLISMSERTLCSRFSLEVVNLGAVGRAPAYGPSPTFGQRPFKTFYNEECAF